MELPANQPVVLLKETDGERYLPIWIGAVEASAIAFQQQGVRSARPLTHDLLCNLVTAFGTTLSEVRITELRDDIFFADLVFANGATVSARPSDAIAMALRCEAQILVDESVLDSAAITIPDEDETAGTEEGDESSTGLVREREVAEFREFLDQISPEDFAAGESGSSGA